MIVELSRPLEFQIFSKNILHFMKRAKCVFRIEAVVFTHVTKVT